MAKARSGRAGGEMQPPEQRVQQPSQKQAKATPINDVRKQRKRKRKPKSSWKPLPVCSFWRAWVLLEQIAEDLERLVAATLSRTLPSESGTAAAKERATLVEELLATLKKLKEEQRKRLKELRKNLQEGKELALEELDEIKLLELKVPEESWPESWLEAVRRLYTDDPDGAPEQSDDQAGSASPSSKKPRPAIKDLVRKHRRDARRHFGGFVDDKGKWREDANLNESVLAVANEVWFRLLCNASTYVARHNADRSRKKDKKDFLGYFLARAHGDIDSEAYERKNVAKNPTEKSLKREHGKGGEAGERDLEKAETMAAASAGDSNLNRILQMMEKTLDVEERQIVLWRCEGKSWDWIATETGDSVHSVKAKHGSVISRLRAGLGV
ncbi:MAG: hypothetical protein K1X74_17225 [Pirellulales bacterium]|nr:hypothetical protein [Pirellulales bacterium]